MTTFREALKTLDRRVATVFLVATLVAPTWWFYCTIPAFERMLGTGTGADVFGDLTPALLALAAMFVLLAVVPAVLIRAVFKDPLRDYGLRLGDVRYGLVATVVTIPIFVVPTVMGGMTMPDLAATYPLSRAALLSGTHFLVYQVAYLVFYLAWEFHFRGFLLFGLEKALGMWPAIGLSLVASALMHLDKPTGEFYASAFAGVVWGWTALRTRSIVWPILVHYAVGIANDVVVATQFHWSAQ